MILFNDSEWEYNFTILMTAIVVACGIYTLIKVLIQKKKENQNNINNNNNNNIENDNINE